jgi:hypothetical protein
MRYPRKLSFSLDRLRSDDRAIFGIHPQKIREDHFVSIELGAIYHRCFEFV